MEKEQILALAEKCGIFPRLTPSGTDEVWGTKRDVESFFYAAIESYKAELLNEAGDPVLYAEFAEDGGWLGDASEYADHLEEPHALFTSDQVAAAIAKATKPLEERRCEICGYAEHHREHTSCLRTQLAAAQEEIKTVTEQKNRMWFEMQTAQDQLAKVEQRVAEWQPIETAPKDGTVFLGYKLGQFRECYKVPRDDCDMWCFGGTSGADDLFPNIKPTHWMPLPKAPNGASS